jgi:hypothetical protein
MGTIGLIGGIGKGIAEGGGIVGKFMQMDAELEEKRKARLEELRAEYAEREKLEVGKEQRTEARVQEAAKKFRPMFGVDETPKTQDNFQRAKPLIGDTTQGPPEELQGPPETTPDTEAFGKYQKKQERGAAMAELAARRPEALDNVSKALNDEKLGALLDEAIKSGDMNQVARVRAALLGRSGRKIQGGYVFDEFDDGDPQATGLTESAIRENDAQAGRARSGSTNDRAGEVGRMAAERVKQLEAQYARIESEKFPEPKNEFDPQRIAALRSEWEDKQRRRLSEISTRMEKAQQEYDRVYGDLSERRGVGGGSSRKPGSLPPLSSFKRGK